MAANASSPPRGLDPRKTWIIQNDRALSDEPLQAALDEMQLRQWPLERIDVDRWEGQDFEARLESLVSDALEQGVGAIAAAGGDGTMHALAKVMWRLAATSIALVPLPFGTGNDLCRSLDRLDLPPLEQLESAMLGTPVPIDLLVTLDTQGGQDVVINTGTWGSAALATHQADGGTKAQLGWWAYVAQGLSNVEVEAWPSRIELDGATIHEGETLFLSVSSGRTTGGGWVVAPEAWLDDGLLDVRIVGEQQSLAAAVVEQLARRVVGPSAAGSGREVAAKDPAAQDSAAEQSDADLGVESRAKPTQEPPGETLQPASETYQGRRLVIELEPTVPCNLDGERSESSVCELRVASGALSVIPGGPGACVLRGASTRS